MSDRVERAVVNLGKYYGAITRDGFVSLLLNRNRNLPAGFQPPDLSTQSVVGRVLLDISEGGRTTTDLIRHINDLVRDASEDVKLEVFKTLKICYEPISNEDDPAKVLLSTTSAVVIGESRTSFQGVKRNQEPTGVYSIRSASGISDSSVTNSNPGAPAPDESSFSVIQVFSPRITLSNRDMGAISLFMNALPTIEISRAVPFIDIVLIQQSGPTSNESSTDNRVKNLSLSQFLLGNKSLSQDTMESTYALARDAEIVTNDARSPEFVSNTGDRYNVTTAGMELFTSPQTLVPGDEDHVESDTLAGSDDQSVEARARRAAPVIDKFRPLMTLKALSFNVVATGGVMSYKTGKISLTLHDRSRLADIAAFVSPEKYANTHLQIEYGWAHPDAKPHESPTDSDASNLFADLISSMRVKEKYQVINPTLSFGESGQIDIELPIAMLSDRAARQVSIGLDSDSTSAFNEVKRLMELIDTIRSRIDSTTATSLFGTGDVIGSLSSVNGLLGMSDDVKRALSRIQVASIQRGATANLRELGAALGSLIGGPSPTRAGSSSGSAIGSLSTSLRSAIQNKIRVLKTTSDPFILPIGTLIPSAQVAGSNPKYVSLGKILSVFAGGPVAASGYYKDFQIIFYNFNEKASYMQNINIASMPIDIDDFQQTLENELDKLANMPLETFMDFMGTYFISDPGSTAYGFGSIYERNRGEENQQRQLTSRYKDDPPGLFAKEQEILSEAYNTTAPHGDLEFKMPTISMYLESIPVLTTDNQLTSDTILRAHIFDSQTTSYTTPQALLQAANNKQIGIINTSFHTLMDAKNRVSSGGETTAERSSRELAVSRAEADFKVNMQNAVDAGLLEPYPATSPSGSQPRHRLRGGLPALKKFLMSTMPSVRFGEGNSGIISAKLTSMQDSANTTIQILNRGKSTDSPIGERQRGLPLKIMPVECTMETIGCPLWGFTQQIFIDFGTGTTADGIYAITGIDHHIASGEFKTNLKLTPIGSYASYFSLFSNIDQSISALEGMDPEAFRAADDAENQRRRAREQAARTRREAAASAADAADAATDTAMNEFITEDLAQEQERIRLLQIQQREASQEREQTNYITRELTWAQRAAGFVFGESSDEEIIAQPGRRT